MSKRFTDLVFDRAPVKGQRLLLLLALASCADADGEFASGYLDHETTSAIAQQARMSQRRARYLIREFMVGGLVYCAHSDGYPDTGWRLNPEAFGG